MGVNVERAGVTAAKAVGIEDLDVEGVGVKEVGGKGVEGIAECSAKTK